MIPPRGRLALAAALAGLVAFGAPAASACGAETDCVVGERAYRIRMPEGHAGVRPVGAIVFAHGHRASAADTLADATLVALAERIGVALIALQGVGDTWALAGAPGVAENGVRDEAGYVDSVIADATRRFPIDPARLVASGFSAGGMLAWTLACERPAQFAGFVPIAGTFWEPIPERCAMPVASIIHIHGDDDSVVPLTGRRIRAAKQGEVDAAIAMYARLGGFGPATERTAGGLACREQLSPGGALLARCLFRGGHVADAAHLGAAWQRLAEAGRL
jgi:polyhydroxybutyrate depolymerase